MERACHIIGLARRVGRDAVTGAVVLRHEPTGQLLTDGSVSECAVRFVDRASAQSFRRRFLDEAGAWEPVPATIAARQAA